MKQLLLNLIKFVENYYSPIVLKRKYSQSGILAMDEPILVKRKYSEPIKWNIQGALAGNDVPTWSKYMSKTANVGFSNSWNPSTHWMEYKREESIKFDIYKRQLQKSEEMRYNDFINALAFEIVKTTPNALIMDISRIIIHYLDVSRMLPAEEISIRNLWFL